jgi:hypothetical protein
MSLLSGLTPPPKHVCLVVKLANELSKEDKVILLEAVADLRWTPNALVGALADRGLKLSRTVIERHRKNLCGCNA